MEQHKDMFKGRNIISGMPEELVEIVSYLNEKTSAGEFEFSNSVSYWENNENIVESFSYDKHGWYFAAALAYITYLNGGNIVFNKTNNIWVWAWGFSIVSGVSGWTPEFMKLVVLSFEDKTDNISNLINTAVQKYASVYYDDAVVLISILPQYKLSCFAGMMERDFNRYCVEYPPKENLEEFATAFVRTKQLATTHVENAFDIVLSYTSFKSSAAMAFFLSTVGRLIGDKKKTCEKKILELLQDDVSPYVNTLCNWLSMQRKTSLFIEQCVILLIKGLRIDNKEVALKGLDNSIHFYLKDPIILTNLFITIAKHLTPMDILKMKRCLDSLHENNDGFLKFSISFIIHPDGLYRIVGRRLWDDYHLESSDFDAQKDLDEGAQCLYVLSMLQDYGNPETRLTKLLPLIKSESTRVRNVLMSCLLPYLDDYMGHVIAAFDKLNINNAYVTTIRQYYEKRADAIEKRRALKELSPKYSYVVEYHEAINTQKQHLHQQMKEAEKNHKSFLMDQMKSVLLARGGGWRDDNGNVQHLGCIQISLPSRQMVQSMTPMEQDEWMNELLKNWNDTSRNN